MENIDTMLRFHKTSLYLSLLLLLSRFYETEPMCIFVIVYAPPLSELFENRCITHSLFPNSSLPAKVVALRSCYERTLATLELLHIIARIVTQSRT